MKTLDKLIKSLEECVTEDAIESEGLYLATDALHYLKEYQRYQNTPSRMGHMALVDFEESQKNVPLTWDELKGMKGKPVWVEYMDDEQQTGWALIVKNPERPTFGKPKLFTFVRDGGRFYLTISGYGKRWQAYRKERS